MKRGKEQEKMGDGGGPPMFPRLHVNDADKGGGPRAPPRNKMALYEQLSVPSSQRFRPSNLAPPPSPQASGAGKNSLFSRSYSQSMPEKLPTTHFRRGSSLSQLEKKRKLREEDDFTVPVFVQSRVDENYGEAANCDPKVVGALDTSANKRELSEQKKKQALTRDFFASSSTSLPAKESNARGSNGFHGSLNQSGQDQNVDKMTRSELSEDSLQQRAASGLLHGDPGNSVGAGNLSKDSEKRTTTLPRGDSVSLEVYNKQENGNVCRINNTGALLQPENGDQCHDISKTSVSETVSMSDVSPDDVVKMIGQKHFWKARRLIVKVVNMSMGKGEHCMKSGNTPIHVLVCSKSLDGAIVVNHLMAGGRFMLSKIFSIHGTRGLGANDDISRESNPGSDSRASCGSQQRVFAVQVFELHRLIKVQQLIAGCPDALLDDSITKLSKKSSVGKKVSSDHDVMPTSDLVKCDEKSQTSNQKIESSAENAVGKTTPMRKDGYVASPHPANSPQVPLPTDPNLHHSSFQHPLGHQWLVPIMSPTEGLIYKPYAVPGFMGSVSGGFGNLGAPPLSGQVMNQPYGFPAPHYHQHHHHHGAGMPPDTTHEYFPPHSLSATNRRMPDSPEEQRNHFTEHASNGQTSRSSVGANQQPSRGTPSQKSAVIRQAAKVRASKDADLLGSTASSLNRGGQEPFNGGAAEGRNGHHPSPMLSAASEGAPDQDTTGRPTRVIKVVPHNPRSANESAARIFQSIQEERRQYESM